MYMYVYINTCKQIYLDYVAAAAAIYSDFIIIYLQEFQKKASSPVFQFPLFSSFPIPKEYCCTIATKTAVKQGIVILLYVWVNWESWFVS